MTRVFVYKYDPLSWDINTYLEDGECYFHNERGELDSGTPCRFDRVLAGNGWEELI